VRLDGTSPQGVPVHPDAGDASFVRWANGTTGKVVAKDTQTGWLEVKVNQQTGWIVKRYLTVLSEPDDDSENPDSEITSYAIGTWNLEWFHNNKKRGFPESNGGGPLYPPRSDLDLALIARVITNDVAARLLVLNEINGTTSKTSQELDRLLFFLGASWKYEIGASGQQQHVAMIYDTRAMRTNFVREFAVPPQDEDGSDIFARDPLVIGFTLLDKAGHAKNDFIMVGLHLASIQSKVQNHNRAMEVLRQRMHAAFQNGSLPSAERDVIIAGDFNASAYDQHVENFWTNYDSELQFRSLIPDDEESYPGTRLAGVPLFPSSRLDYILASGVQNGALKDIVQWVGHVHTELLAMGPDNYRRQVSDHLPVTIRVKVQNDDD
jgi:endonuclease/exonuclease/phosphatase family metal-dependent hydrolase